MQLTVVVSTGKENGASLWKRVFIFEKKCVRDESCLFKDAAKFISLVVGE